MRLFDAFPEEKEEDLQNTTEKVTKYAKNAAIFIIATVMIVYGFSNMYSIIFLDDDESWVNAVNTIISIVNMYSGPYPEVHLSRFLRVPGTIMFIVCGFLLYLDVRRNFLRAVGLYALCMGTSRIITCVPFLISTEDFSNGIGWLVTLFGINLCYSGYSLLSGSVRGKYGIFFASTVFSGFYMIVIGFLTYVVYMSGAMDVVTYVEDMYTLLIPFAMYFILLWVIDTDEIRYNDKMSRHIRILNSIDATYRTIESLTFTEKEAEQLIAPGSEGWTVFNHNNGPVQKEMKVVAVGPYGTAYITIQKWYDSDSLYFTLSSSESGTLLLAQRLKVDRATYYADRKEIYLTGQFNVLCIKVVPDTEVPA